MMCLMCNESVEHYWHSINVPGDYCAKCISIVAEDHMHSYLERYSAEVVRNFALAKGLVEHE